jgi:phage recombination protein Bet
MNNEQIDVLRRTIAKGCTNDEFELFLQVCIRTGLDPFARQICPVSRWDKKEGRNVMSIQVQVDGFRVLAQRTGQYAGSDRALFDEGLSLFEHMRQKRGLPLTCYMTVYRIVSGQRCAFTSEIAWNDFYPGDKLGFMWNAKPYQMMAKAAESQALRKAFQLELSNLSTEEETAIEMTTVVSRPTAARSASWMDAQRQLNSATTAKEVGELMDQFRNQFPVGEYELQRANTIALERIAMEAERPVSQTTLPKKNIPKTETGVNFFRVKTGYGKQTLEEIANSIGLPLSSAEMTVEQQTMMITAILVRWYEQKTSIATEKVLTLVKTAIEKTEWKTEQELWDELSLSVEAYQEEMKDW